jgi:hypothetical protein
MIGGTSRAVVEEVVEVAGVERGCDIVVEEGEVDAVIEGDSDWLDEEEDEDVSCCSGSAAVKSALLASGFRETPRSCWISSEVRPFDSRKETLRSVDASRIDSSSRNLDAWSMRSCREADAGASSGLGDCDDEDRSVGAEPGCRCHGGMDGGFDEGSDIVSVIWL